MADGTQSKWPQLDQNQQRSERKTAK
ncbi:short chain dehydrogenase [Idiomarina baltica OS145]|uniref:Short chain dehydrogenase n=1 Tax=Idiomarina baltica OS145 TaxID=314276 RepID=A0ABM9WJM9_9GAMM|nr:short chain dehydrogenase [Idiomarina baltica OS145]